MRPFGFSFWKQSTLKGSVALTANSATHLSLVGSSDWAVGTGDFTIEGWYYQTNNGNTNYLYSLGNADTLSASIASGGNKFQVHIGGSRIVNVNITTSTSIWYHWAVSRSSGTINTYFDGTRINTQSNSTNVTDNSSSFFIGYDGVNSSSYWPGNMTNFRFVKGTGLYTGTSLTKPTTNLTPVANTKLLLLFANTENFLTDLSGTNKTVTNNNSCVWSALSPY